MLLERDNLLGNLADRLLEIRAGTGRLVLLAGEAGAGKSTLIEEFLRRADRSLRVLRGGCDSLLKPRPFSPLFDMARALGGELKAAIESQSVRRDVFEVFIEILSSKPCIAVFEDVHWADQASIDLFCFISRRIAATQALVILSYRDDAIDRAHALHRMLGDLPRTLTTRLQVEPLSRRAVEELAKAAGRSSQGLYDRTGGNAFFVAEILASNNGKVPRSVQDLMRSRTAALSPLGRDAAELVAACPGRAERRTIEAALADPAPAIDECLEQGLLRQTGDTIAFRHELVREAQLESLPPQRRRALHERILSALLADTDAPLAHLVHHASLAERADLVVRVAPRAGREAPARGAHREAAEHFEAALRWSTRLAEGERLALLDAAAYESHLSGNASRALELRHAQVEIARRLGDAQVTATALCSLSRLEWFLGLRREAEADANAAIAQLIDAAADAALARAYAIRAQLHMLASEVQPAIEWSQRALELADRFGSLEVRVSALNTLGAARMIGGDRSGRELIEQSLALSRSNDLEEDTVRAWVNLVWTSQLHGERAAAERAIDSGLEFCIDRHLEAGRVMLLGLRAESRLARGDWREACIDAESAVVHVEMPLQLRLPGLIALARQHVRSGEARAGEVLAQTLAVAQPTAEPARLLPLAAIAAEHAFHSGDAALMQRARAIAEPWQTRSVHPWAQGELAYWRARSGDPAEEQSAIADPWRLTLRGNTAAAEAAWANLGQPYERALALAGGDVAERREALAEFDRLGATPAASRLRRELRAAGVSMLPRGPRASTRNNAAGLTKRELDVLTLLDKSLRDAQIAEQLHLSVKTVGHHVSAILAKLNATSRLQAVSIAQVRGLLRTRSPERAIERRRQMRTK